VEKDRFLFLIQHYTSLSEVEAEELDGLQKSFPYSQVIHNLAARAAHDNQLETYNRLLQISAVYTTDRAVLKQVMTQPCELRVEFTISNPEMVEQVQPRVVVASIETGLSGDALINEVNSDLVKLKELRHKFELSLAEFEKENEHPLPLPEKKKGKRVAEHIETDKHEILIEEIKSTKKEIDPDSEKQKEQFQIIDKFIKTSPSISKAKSVAETPEDLAENSISFGDHIISETLVEILLKQGKNEKAIEVLRKLIWKFPQKKAIFAAQIDSLRK